MAEGYLLGRRPIGSGPKYALKFLTGGRKFFRLKSMKFHVYEGEKALYYANRDKERFTFRFPQYEYVIVRLTK